MLCAMESCYPKQDIILPSLFWYTQYGKYITKVILENTYCVKVNYVLEIQTHQQVYFVICTL